MALTLNDVLGAPSDPNALNDHLLSIGAIPPPPAPPAAIAPTSPAPLPTTGTPVAPMGRPKIGPVDDMAMFVKHSGHPSWTTTSENPDASAPMTPPAAPDLGGVKTMTPPDLTKAPAAATPAAAPALAPFTPAVQPGPDTVAAMVRPNIPGRPQLTGEPGSPEWFRSKIAQDEWDKANPWGSAANHPGTLGKIAHVLGEVGQVGAHAIVPNVVEGIPGTMYNRNINENMALRNLGEAQTRETAAKQAGTQAANVASEIAGRDVETAKKQSEQTLNTDAQGNVTGWKDAKGVLHDLDDPATSGAIKRIADATSAKLNKPTIEKMDDGQIVAIVPDPAGGKPTAHVVFKGDPKLETDLTQKTVNGQEHHILVDKKNGREIADLGAFKTETSPTQALAQQKADERLVIGHDQQGNTFIVPKAQADEMKLEHIGQANEGDRKDAENNTSALNELGVKTRNLDEQLKALDQNAFQRGIIAMGMSHDTGTTTDQLLKWASSLGASQETQDFLIAAHNLRESALNLPKVMTGSARMTEVQANALWKTVADGSSRDSKYAKKQLQAFDEMVGRQWNKVPLVEGNNREYAYPEKHKGRTSVTEAAQSGGGEAWKPPEGAPAAPQKDGKVLRDASGNIVARSKGGEWRNPNTP